MVLLLLVAAAWSVDRHDLVRVDDPDHPDAVCRSATGAVLLEPPAPGTPWVFEPVPWTDEVDSEAVGALNVDTWRGAGATGAGVSVAVFDLQWFGAEDHLDELGHPATWDCWAHPSCAVPMDTWRPRFAWEQGAHGLACAEVIHDLAPDAELHLVRVGGLTALENAVAWAIRQDVDLVSMSMSFFNSSFYDGTGRVSALMDELRASGILMVTSAGNYARQHWRGPGVDADGDGWLDLDGDGSLWVWMESGGPEAIYLSWDQFRTCGATDLDAWLLDADGDVVGRSRDDQDRDGDHCQPVERLVAEVEEDGWYRLGVTHRRGELVDLRLAVFSRAGALFEGRPHGSIADPGVSPHVLTVGAVSVHGYLDNDVEPFSSQGPTAAGLSKPDIAGPDGLTTAAYGPAAFYGTSASTPAVAGALAVAMSADPDLDPFLAAERLEGWALGDQVAWERPDPRWGAGKARLPAPEVEAGCGRRRLLLPLVLPPLALLRRRRRARGGSRPG